MIVLNTFVAFVFINLLALVVLWWSDKTEQPTRPYKRAWLIEGYGLDTLARAYPGLSRDQVEAFLYETSNWFQEYEAFTGFRPVERHDRFITIDRAGFRPVPSQASWPPDDKAFNVFLFGGSTMMGAGVPDDQTIAAHLQSALRHCAPPIHVYNFGRGFYFSTQERILFEQLILSGHSPDAAIFLDGLNDFYFADGVPQFTHELTTFMQQTTSEEKVQEKPSLLSALTGVARALPVVRLARHAGLTSDELPPNEELPQPTGAPRSDAERIQNVIERWNKNRQIIESVAERYGVRVALVWQPVPTYAYDRTKLNVYREGTDLFGAHQLSEKGYEKVAASYRTDKPAQRVLWLGDMQRDRAENLYVDAVHYTGSFSAEIAARIVKFAASNEIVPCTT